MAMATYGMKKFAEWSETVMKSGVTWAESFRNADSPDPEAKHTVVVEGQIGRVGDAAPLRRVTLRVGDDTALLYHEEAIHKPTTSPSESSDRRGRVDKVKELMNAIRIALYDVPKDEVVGDKVKEDRNAPTCDLCGEKNSRAIDRAELFTIMHRTFGVSRAEAMKLMDDAEVQIKGLDRFGVFSDEREHAFILLHFANRLRELAGRTKAAKKKKAPKRPGFEEGVREGVLMAAEECGAAIEDMGRYMPSVQQILDTERKAHQKRESEVTE